MKLQFEKEVLGFYLTEHPITMIRKSFRDIHVTTKSLRNLRPNAFVKLVGLVETIRQVRTKKGELMAFVQLTDEFGNVSLTLFPKEYNGVIGWIKEELTIIVEGQLEMRNGKPQIKTKSIYQAQNANI